VTMLDKSAVFLGASPLGTALVLSLLITLVVILTGRLVLVLSRLPAPDWLLDISRRSRRWVVLGLGLAIFGVGVSVLASLTEGVTQVPAVSDWDQHFVVTAHANLGGAELAFFHVVTQMAGRAASIILGLGVGLFLLLSRDRRMLRLWAVGLIGNSIIIQLLKQFYQRPRPELITPYLTEHNFSFPSGHASASILMYGLLAYIIYIRFSGLKRAGRQLLGASVIWLGVLIGTSRLALGVHYPTDVLAGWAVAVSWLSILICMDRFGQYRNTILEDGSVEDNRPLPEADN